MANQTPEGHFEYPELNDGRWYENGTIIEVDGVSQAQSHDGIVDWLEQLEIRLTGIVETEADLPSPDADRTDDRTGNERIYLVRSENVLYRDTGTAWVQIAGHGAESTPVETIYSEVITLEPKAEPDAPASGCVRWYDETDDAYKLKFDNGNIVTLATK